MPDLRSFRGELAGLAGGAVRTFFGTVLVLAAAGLVLAATSYWFLRTHPLYGLIAAAVALAESIAAGVALGVHRAVALTLARGVSQLQLGRSLVRWLFEHLIGGPNGERPGGRIAQAVERLPLAQAEDRLTTVVNRLTHAPPADVGERGWFRRRLRGKLLGLVQTYTLVRFRDEGAKHGGVDLVKVQADLEPRVDDFLVAKLRGGLKLWMVVVILALPAAVFVQTYWLLMLLQAK